MATLHCGTTFVIADEAGDFDTASQGYYAADVRHLSQLRLALDGQPTVPLGMRRDGEARAVYHLTNPRLDGAGEATLAIVRAVSLDGALHEELRIQNFGDAEARFTLALALDSDFAEIFDVKKRVQSGVAPPHEGGARLRRHRWRHSATLSSCVVGDDECETEVRFSERPRFSDHEARFSVRLPRRARFELRVDVTTHRQHRRDDRLAHAPGPDRTRHTTIDTDHRTLARAYAQAARDAAALRWLGPDHQEALCGGIPWYLALFGRDSLIAAYESILHDPRLCKGTLETLAALQGQKDDPETKEEPGKILHEHRPELQASARADVPRYPYYGTVDATPLFVLTLVEYARLTGDLALASRLWVHVERAIGWILRRFDNKGGLISYDSRKDHEIQNLGWKDSPDSVRFADGRVASGEVALVEVQGYSVAALEGAAALGAHLGRGRNDDWCRRAAALRAVIDERFWLGARDTFAEALVDGAPVDALTSNPGHLLFARAISPARAAAVARTLTSDAMFSGFGVRTMGRDEGGFNPMSYHCGSVWPHDNALILLGLRRYGLDAAASRVLAALLDSLAGFAELRPPELFSGFAREKSGVPIAYPGANSPQAWATGAVLMLPRVIAGLDVDREARVVSLAPLAVDGMQRLTIDHLPLAGHTIRLELRWQGGACRARIEGLPDGWRVDENPCVTRGPARAS